LSALVDAEQRLESAVQAADPARICDGDRRRDNLSAEHRREIVALLVKNEDAARTLAR